MSISLTPNTGYGSLDAAIADALSTQNTITLLTNQTASGYMAPDYAGLGAGAQSALDLTGQIGVNSALSANLNDAGAQMNVAQTALTSIQSILTNITEALTLAQSSGTPIAAVAAEAQTALQQVVAALDTQYGSIYVFAGQDRSNPPIPNPAQITQSAFYAAVQNATGGLAVNGAAAVTTQVLAAASPGATSPYSATIEASNAPASVSLGGSTTLQLGILADQNSDAVSTGVPATSTGSYMRDILAGLASISTLNAGDQTAVGFNTFLATLGTSLTNAASAMGTDVAALGSRQNVVTNTQNELSDVNTALKSQLSNVQDVDLSQVATQLSEAQTQLQASYQVISSLSTLSLAKFLPI